MAHVSVRNIGRLMVDEQMISCVAQTVLQGEALGDYAVSLCFCGDEYIHEANKTFLNHDYPTDVIAFPLSDEEEGDEEDGPYLGDCLVSVERAACMAKEYHHTVEQELVLYVIHGLLHLAGYDDVKDDDRAVMREKEMFYMEKVKPMWNEGVLIREQ